MTTSRARHLCQAFFALTALLAAPAGAGWEPLGGPTRLGVDLRIAPSAPATLYASVINAEVPRLSFLWRSDDSGRTWRSLQPQLMRPLSALVLDPGQADVAWAWVPSLSAGFSDRDELWRTADGWVTWERRFQNPQQGFTPPVVQLIADPDDPQTIYRVELDVADHFRLDSSHDGGRTFREGAPIEQQPTPDGVVLRPEDGELIAFTDGGLYASRDDGATWSRRGAFRGTGFVAGVAAASESRRLYGVPATGGACLARSDDAGARWRRLAGPRLPRAAQCTAVAVDPADADHLWVVARKSQHGYAPFRCFSAESTDGGGNWSAARDLSNGRLLATGSRLFSFGNCAGAPGRALAASTDGGRRWTSVGDGLGGGDGRQGLAVLRRPDGGRRVVIFDSNHGYGALFASNGGNPWNPLSPQYPFALTPAGPFDLLTLTSSLFGGTELLRSTDGGESWRPLAGAPDGGVAFHADPRQPRSLMLETFIERGYPGSIIPWLSDDGGLTWRVAETGLPTACDHVCGADVCPAVTAYATDPFVPTRRWLGFQEPYTCVGGGASRLYVSSDSGASWQPGGELPSSGNGIAPAYALHADPRLAGRLLAGTVDGVWESLDAGLHWSRLGTGLAADTIIDELRLDEGTGTWYAASFESGIFRGVDDGRTWEPLDGAPDLSGPSIAIDPLGGLLAAFRGLGVWRWAPGASAPH
jgi:photosystem II stability/assembly factor-like uncharacterized protein